MTQRFIPDSVLKQADDLHVQEKAQTLLQSFLQNNAPPPPPEPMPDMSGAFKQLADAYRAPLQAQMAAEQAQQQQSQSPFQGILDAAKQGLGMGGPQPMPTGGNPDKSATIRAAAQAQGVNPDIFDRQLTQEGAYSDDVWQGGRNSSAGARGPGQFMTPTGNSVADQMGIPRDQFWASPELQVQGAAFHMAQLLKANGGDYAKALAAYNAGQGAVDQYGGVPPYPETQTYIKNILGNGGPYVTNDQFSGRGHGFGPQIDVGQQPQQSQADPNNPGMERYGGSAAMLADNAPGTESATPASGVAPNGGIPTPLSASVPNRSVKGYSSIQDALADPAVQSAQYQLGGPDGQQDGTGSSVALGAGVRTTDGSASLVGDGTTGASDPAIQDGPPTQAPMAGQLGGPDDNSRDEQPLPDNSNANDGYTNGQTQLPTRDNAWSSGDLSQPVASGSTWQDTADQPFTPDPSASIDPGAAGAPGGDALSSPPVEPDKPLPQKIADGLHNLGDMFSQLFGGGDQNPAPEAPQRPATADNFNLPAAEHAAQNAATVLPDATLSGMQAANQGFEAAQQGVGDVVQSGVDKVSSMRDEQDALMAEYNGLMDRQLHGENLSPDEEWRLAQLTRDVGMGTFAGGLEGIGKVAGTGLSSAGRRGAEEAIKAGAPGAEQALANAEPTLSERVGGFIKGMAPGAGRAAPEMASGVVSGAQDAGQYDRYYHGTGSDFARPDAGKFDPNGLFGPGYYVTDHPDVAGSGDTVMQKGYAEQRGKGALMPPDVWTQAAHERESETLADLQKRYDREQASLQSTIQSRDQGLADNKEFGHDVYNVSYMDKRIAEQTPIVDRLKEHLDWQSAHVDELRQKLDAPFQAGPNVRPVDVPRDLNLLDADAPVPQDVAQRIADAVSKRYADILEANGRRALGGGGFKITENVKNGEDLFALLESDKPSFLPYGDGRRVITQAMADAGYDGIKYAGGKRIPMTDAAGNAIEHNAIAVFPESLDKLRNATAGTPGGLMPRTPAPKGSGQAVDQAMATMGKQALQGGVSGAVGEYQNDPNATPADILKAGAVGAVQRVALGQARSVIGAGGASTLARAVRTAGRAGQQAAEGLPIQLTDAEEAKRINVDKLVPQGTPQEVKDFFINNARGSGWFHEQRRGVRPDAMVAEDALAINANKSIDDWIRGGKAGKAYNPEESRALRNVYRTQENVVENLKKALDGPLTTSERDQKMAEYLNELTLFRGIGEVAEGARAEAGRTFRQYRDWGKLLEADPTLHARRYLDKLYGGFDGADKVLQNYQQMQTDGASPQQLAGFLRQTGDPSWVKRNLNRLQIFRYANMLSGTLTHIINTEGTLTNAAAEAGPVKAGAVGIDMLRSMLPGQEREVFAGEILPQLRGGLAGALEGARQIPDILKTGVTMDEATRLEHLHAGFASGNAVVDAAMESPLRLLKAEDAFTTSIARGGHLSELAYRQAFKEGLKGSEASARASTILSDPVTNWRLFERAGELAKRDAFQEVRPATTWLQQGKGMGGFTGGLLNTIMPFVKTPYNIAAQGLGYTPAGFLDVLKSARAGNTGEAEMAASRAMLGTGVTYLGVNLATSGYLTGDYPDDDATRSTLPNGWKPWSVRIPHSDGSATYINYSNMGPLGIPLAIGAITGDAIKRGDNPMTWLPQAAVGTGKFMMDSTFLQGLSQFTQAINQPERYAENLSEGLATQWMPAAAMQREIQNALGMATRDPHGAVEALLATTINPSAKIPATPWTPEVQAQKRQDRLGRDVLPTQTGVGAVVAPVRYGVSQPDPVLDTFRDAGIGLSAPPKFITDETVKAPLSREEQATYQSYVGDILQQRVTPGMSEKRLQDLYEEAKQRGRDYMIRQIGRSEIRARARGEVTVK